MIVHYPNIFQIGNMNPPNEPPEVNVNGQTTTIERPQTSAAIAAKNSSGKYREFNVIIN